MARVPGGFGVRTRGMRRQGPVDRFDESVGEDAYLDERNPARIPEAMDAAFMGDLEAQGGVFPATDSTRAERDAFRDELLAVVIPVMLGLVGMGAGGATAGVSTTLRNAGMASSPRNVLGGLFGGAKAGAPYRSAMHQGFGPGYRPAVPGQSPLHMPPGVRPMPRQPAVRDFGSPPGRR